MTHLVSSKQENVGLVYRTKFVTVEGVFFHDQATQMFGLLKVRASVYGLIPFSNADQILPVVPQFDSVYLARCKERRTSRG